METTTATPPYEEHLGAHRPYWRDIILGVNDGLVSMFLLVVGIVGGGLVSRTILLTGIAGAAAGAISMAAGEYMATKSQEEVFEAEIALEREHFLHHRDHELGELRDMLQPWGIEGPLLEEVVEKVGSDDETLLKAMMALEFGILESERRSPYVAAVASGSLFLAGSIPSVLPFAFTDNTALALALATIGVSIGLVIVGVAKTVVTRTNPVWAGVENLLIAGAGAVIAFGVGVTYNRIF